MRITQRRSATQVLHPKRVPMATPRAARDAKIDPATAMAVTATAARVATARSVETYRSVVNAASARTVRRLKTSNRWKALRMRPEGPMRLPPRSTGNRVPAILQCLLQCPPHRRKSLHRRKRRRSLS